MPTSAQNEQRGLLFPVTVYYYGILLGGIHKKGRIFQFGAPARQIEKKLLQSVAYAGGELLSVRPRRPSSIPYMLQACVAQILLEKSYIHVEKFLRVISACRAGGTVPCPPFDPAMRC